MSFAKLKNKSKNNFASLKGKIENEKSGKKFGDDRIWSPTVDKAKNGFAVIRFLPEPEGDDMPYVKLYNHGFQVGSRWLIENCPTTIGKDCPICSNNNEMWNTGIQSQQNIVRQRKRRVSYFSNILVLSDKAAPENEGKVFLFRYGAKIFQKILEAIEPQFEDENAFNPFDFWEGADFKLKIRDVEGYRNYDKSEFASPSPLMGGDDAELEKLWKQEYSLAELIAPDKFKSYDDLQSKLHSVLGVENSHQADIEEEENKFDDEGDETHEKLTKSNTSKPKEEPKAHADDSDVDSDLEMYASLLSDD